MVNTAISRELIRLRESRKFRIITLLVGMIWGLPCAILIRFLSPIITIRIGFFLCQYLGHYAGDVGIYLCERKSGINVPKGRYVDLWFNYSNIVSNSQIEKMWRQRLIVLPRLFLAPIHKANSLLPGGAVYQARSSFHDRDVRNVLDSHPPTLKFSEHEELLGQKMLQNLGVPLGSQFVCLLVRDNAYHSNLSFTNYRNADIYSYIPAIEELGAQGIYVVRMGKRVSSKVQFHNEKFIDYAGKGMTNDFLDIYLAANCKFVISTSSGWDMVASTLFHRPVLFTNMVPVSHISSWTNRHSFIFKRHWSIPKNRFLSQSEIFETIDKDYTSSTPNFEEKGVILVENTAEDIKNATIEFLKQLDKTSHKTDEENSDQSKFWQLYKKNIEKHGLTKFHGEIKSNIPKCFLSSAPEFLS